MDADASISVLDFDARVRSPLELAVASVAKRLTGRVLAAAEIGGLGFCGFKSHRGHAAAFMAAVTERLIGAHAAGAPGITLARFEFDGIWTFLSNGWFGHLEKHLLAHHTCRLRSGGWAEANRSPRLIAFLMDHAIGRG